MIFYYPGIEPYLAGAGFLCKACGRGISVSVTCRENIAHRKKDARYTNI